MGRSVVPIAEFGQDLATAGRIRFGKKNSRKLPEALKTFRLTSGDRTAVEQLAAMYGGEVKEWNDPKANPQHQWEVETEADEIPVWLPPAPLMTTYEHWQGGSNVRRCDGVTCEVAGRDDMQEVPCLCDAAGAMTCKPQVRLTVVMPHIRFGGGWRLDTGGWAALREMPTMVSMVQQMQAQSGLAVAVLRLEQRMSQGGAKRYVVPTLTIDATPVQIMAGENRAAVGSGERPGLSGEEVPVAIEAGSDEDVVDAEVVDDIDVWSLPNAPREPVELTDKQVDGLLSGVAKWSEATEGRVIKA